MPRRQEVPARRSGRRHRHRPASLFYPRARLAIEYDGETHRDRLAEDDRRQNRLQRAGYRLLRYTASDVYGRADEILAEVRGQL